MQSDFFLLATLGNDLFLSAGDLIEMPDGSLMVRSATARYVAWTVCFLAIAIVSGWFWKRRKGGRFAPVCFVGSFLIPVIVLPAIAMESVRVTPEILAIREGYWFAPKEHHIPLASVDRIIEVAEIEGSEGRRRKKTSWEFHFHKGQPLKLKLPNLMEANRQRIMEHIEKCAPGIEQKSEFRE